MTAGGGGRRTGRASSSGAAVKISAATSSGASGSGLSFGVADWALVWTVPITTGSGRRDSAGPSATKWPRANVAADIAAGDDWRQVLELSERLPDDVQSVFLTIAHAAVTAAPCPADAALARIYGTHSVGRARRLLTYFEEQNLVVVRTDFHGRRIVAFPDLGIETAPGDPNARDEAQAAAQ